jgi:hypothetical protein
MSDKIIELNAPQLMVVAAKQKNINLEGGRGVGKSTIIAKRFIDLCTTMPRGTFFISGDTFSQILTRTWPSTKEGLEKFGWYEGIHYFIGRKPEKRFKWDLAHGAPPEHDRFINTFTGTGFHLISLSDGKSGRGLNTDGGIGDEVSTYDEEAFNSSALMTKRGNKDRFGDKHLHLSTLLCYSTPARKKYEWVYRYEQLALEKPNEYLYLRASSYHNRKNLGNEYFSESKRILTPLMYSIEIENIRPSRIEGGFYPSFNDLIVYKPQTNSYLLNLGYDVSKLTGKTCLMDGDCIPSAQLEIALDYGANINCLVVGQMDNEKSIEEFKILKSFFVKWPENLKKLVQDFCDYYKLHRNRTIRYYYDHTAVGRDPAREYLFKDVVIDTLRENNFYVEAIDCGQAPGHHSKYIFFQQVHDGSPEFPRVTYNEYNNKYLILSINNAGVKDGKNGFEKDKSTEQNKAIPDEETTHLSDAHDTLVYFKFLNQGSWFVQM